MELFKLIGKFAVDGVEEANRQIKQTGENAEDASKDVKKFGDEGTKTESKITKAFSSIGKVAAKLGKTVAAGVAAGTAAMAGLTYKALNLGGELEQNTGGSEAVFKEYAANMQAIAKEAYASMGLATSDYLATANKMGALFQGAGFDIQESADLSAKAMQRAADVASIMGLDTASAMESIAGAAKGNFTMMDNLGVAMNETTLEAYALSKGIDKAYSSMSNQEKIGLAMELFLEKTAYAAGNYKKENETLAGSMGTLKAAFVNFLDGSGSVDALVGAFTGAAEVVVGNLQVLLPRLIAGLSQLLDKLIPMLPALIQDVLPALIKGGVNLVQGLIAALPKILSALSEALPKAFADIPFLGELFAQLMPMLENLFAMLMPMIGELLQLLLPIGEMLVTTLLPPLMQIIEMILPVLMSLITTLLPALTPILDLLQPILDLTIALLDPLLKIISAILPPLIDIIEAAVDMLVWLLKPAIEGITKTIEFISPVLVDIGHLFGQIWTDIAAIWAKAGDFFRSVVDAVKQPFQNIADWFGNIFSVAWQKVKDVFSAGGQVFEGIKEGIASVFSKVVNGLISGINNVIQIPFDGINGMLSKIKNINIMGIKPFDFITTLAVPQIPQLETGTVLEKGQVGLLEGNGAEAVVPLDKNKKWIHALAEDMRSEFGNNSFNNDAILKKLDELIRAIMSLRIYLDGEALVGEIAPAMNSALGTISMANERGQ